MIARDPTPDRANFYDRMPIVLPSRLHEMWPDPRLEEKEPFLALLNHIDIDRGRGDYEARTE